MVAVTRAHGVAPTQTDRVGAIGLVRELLDLAAFKTGLVRIQLFSDQLHQEVEAENIHHSHRKDRSIGEVDNRTKRRRCTDHNEDAEDDLEHQLRGLTFVEEIRSGFQAVVAP